MDLFGTRELERGDEITHAFVTMPAGPRPLINGPIPEAHLVKIARDVDAAIRRDEDERVVSSSSSTSVNCLIYLTLLLPSNSRSTYTTSHKMYKLSLNRSKKPMRRKRSSERLESSKWQVQVKSGPTVQHAYRLTGIGGVYGRGESESRARAGSSGRDRC